MKLSETVKKRLLEVIQAANSIGIESLLIDEESIRGTGADKTLLLIDKNVPDMSELGSMGINRVNVLSSRMGLVKDDKDLNIDANIRVEDNGDKMVDKLTLKNKRTTVEFKCCRSSQISAHKVLKNGPIYEFDISEESVATMMRANAAMGNDTVAFSLDDTGNVMFKLNDSSGDTLNHLISDKVNILDDNEAKTFFFNYNKRLFLPLIKMAFKEGTDTLKLSLNKRGIMNLTILSLNIYIIPEV